MVEPHLSGKITRYSPAPARVRVNRSTTRMEQFIHDMKASYNTQDIISAQIYPVHPSLTNPRRLNCFSLRLSLKRRAEELLFIFLVSPGQDTENFFVRIAI